MAAEQIKSVSVTSYDAVPYVMSTAGQGGSGRRISIDDYAPAAAVPLASTKSIYRVLRFPTGAIVKQLLLATDKALDSGTPTLAVDVNVAWASGTNPAWCPPQFQLASLGLAVTEAVIPTTAYDGLTTTTVAAYSAPNKVFGTVTFTSNSAAYGPTNITFNGSQTANSGALDLKNLTSMPMWQLLGFVDGRSNPADPGGFFDILLYVSTAANTGVAGNFWMELTYLI
jgi:hypothetical protein